MPSNARRIVEATATVTEASASFSSREVSFISNDGSYDLILNFDAATTASGAITLKPGEAFTSLPVICQQTVYYKSVTGNTSFRLWGVA